MNAICGAAAFAGLFMVLLLAVLFLVCPGLWTTFVSAWKDGTHG